MSLPKSPKSSSASSHPPHRPSGLLTASSLALATVWYARFYQAGPAPVVETAKDTVLPCRTLVLPSAGRHLLPPAETFLPCHRSSEHMCQSRVALPCFGPSPRSRSLCRLLLAPAAIRIFSTLFCESFLGCLVPCPGGPIGCMRLLTSPMSSAFPLGGWVSFPLWSTMQLFVGTIFEAADISLCSCPQVCSPPRLLPPLRLCRRAAEAFTSGQNVLRCLRTHRIY